MDLIVQLVDFRFGGVQQLFMALVQIHLQNNGDYEPSNFINAWVAVHLLTLT